MIGLSTRKTVDDIERLWSEDDFLYFDTLEDQWYYRITRDDLRRKQMDLRSFLRPIYQILVTMAEFNRVIEGRPHMASLTKALTTELALRIQQPKRVTDLFSNSE